MPRRSPSLALCCLLLASLAAPLVVSGCGNNLAALYQFRRGGGGGGPTDSTGVVVVEELGRLFDGRPRVEDAFPNGSGWPATVPIVIQFNESISRDSVEPPAPGPGQPRPPARIGLRAEGSTQNLPVLIEYVLGDTTVVLRPLANLPAATTFEVFVGPETADVDGIQKGGSGDQVVTTFRADQDAAFADGHIVTLLPFANARDVHRETEVWVVFDKPAVATTVTTTSFVVADQSGSLQGTIDSPLDVQGIPDPRFFRFRPRNPFAGGTQHDVSFDATIQFGTTPGELNFEGRTPFAHFSTVEFAQPVSVTVGNAVAGFPDKINAQNLANAMIDVAVGASASAGSRVLLRVYGLEPKTQATGDLTWFDTSVDVTVAGPTTVTLPIGAALGTAGRLRFEEGGLAFAARVASGRRASAFTFSVPANSPALDVTPPVVDAFLPAVAGASTDAVTDQEAIALTGRASEPLGAVELTDGSVTVPMHAAGDDGSFTVRPIAIPRSDLPRNIVLTATDRAGNLATAAVNGRVLRRGYATGALAGSLTVEAYDDATLAPIAGATVVLEPGMPQNPPSPNRRVGTTGADGRAVFAGIVDPSHSITIAAANHHLVTLLDTTAALVSLPLRPQGAAATASVDGTLLFVPQTGQSARVGINVLDDPLAYEVAPTQAAPTRIPATAIRAGRPVVLSAFTAGFEPIAVPAYAGFAHALAGATGVGAGPGGMPQVAGQKLTGALTILPSTGTIAGLAAPFSIDFAQATGFGTITGALRVRSMLTIPGFAGGSLAGVGVATSLGGTQYSINANWPVGTVLALGTLGPALWVQVEATDADGNTSLHRTLVTNATFGSIFGTGAPLGPPAITTPVGPSTGPPVVEFLDRNDAASIPGGIAFHSMSIEDAGGLRWSLILQDLDGQGGTQSVQVPVLAGVAASLGVGNWKVRVASELMFGVGGVGDFSLEERHRQLVKAARTPLVTFVVQ